MRSLFLRVFVSFWFLIGAIIGAAAVGGFLYAERLQATIESFEVGNSLSDATRALAENGRAGLAAWVRSTPRDDGVIVYVVDDQGRDLLNRHIPYAMQRYLQRHSTQLEPRPRESDGQRRSRRTRFLPQLVGPQGERYTLMATPVRSPQSFWTDSDVRLLLLLFALVTSGIVSYALATAVSRPVRKLRDATLAIAAGDLDARVAGSVGRRRDELGMLGRDFDTMAEKLQRAAEQQTELSRNISHELRSPLARMRVAVELARRKAGDLPEFDRLDSDAERLDSLIGQILSYTRLDADAVSSMMPVDLHDVISEVTESANFEYRGRKHAAISQASTAGAVIQGRRGILVSAVENVVRNALRHSPADSEVGIHLEAVNGAYVIRVVDEGKGVPEEDLERLFEPFFRTRDSAENDGNGGTGLGLAIARRAVQLHGGSIEARNREGGGFEVRITLPASP